MKKVLGLLLASTLILGACGNNTEKKQENKTESVNENKAQFKNDTLVIDDAVLKIKDVFIVNDKNSDDRLLTFKYEVKNKTDKDEVTASNVWIASTKVEQEDSSTVNKLDVGVTPSTGKYKEWFEHSDDTIKKGKTAKGIMSYTLQNDEDVTLKLYKGTEDKELGSKKIKLDDLKTVDYDAAEDLNNESANKNTNEKENTVATANSSNVSESRSTEVNQSTTKELLKETDNVKQNTNSTNPSPKQSQQPESNNVEQPTEQVDPAIVAHNDNQSMMQTRKMIEHNQNFDPKSGGDLYNIETGNFVDDE